MRSSGMDDTIAAMPDKFKRPHPDEIPSSVDDALDVLADIIPEGDLARIAAMDDEELSSLHFTLGAAIRNQFGLWDSDSPLLANLVARIGNVHPDDASIELIRLLRHRLAGQ